MNILSFSPKLRICRNVWSTPGQQSARLPPGGGSGDNICGLERTGRWGKPHPPAPPTAPPHQASGETQRPGLQTLQGAPTPESPSRGARGPQSAASPPWASSHCVPGSGPPGSGMGCDRPQQGSGQAAFMTLRHWGLAATPSPPPPTGPRCCRSSLLQMPQGPGRPEHRTRAGSRWTVSGPFPPQAPGAELTPEGPCRKADRVIPGQPRGGRGPARVRPWLGPRCRVAGPRKSRPPRGIHSDFLLSLIFRSTTSHKFKMLNIF